MSDHEITSEEQGLYDSFAEQCDELGLTSPEDKLKLFKKAKLFAEKTGEYTACVFNKKTFKKGVEGGLLMAVAMAAGGPIGWSVEPEGIAAGFLIGMLKGTKSCMAAHASELQQVRMIADDFR